MRDVWVAIPTAQKSHVPAQLRKWQDQGYKLALFVDPGPVDLPEIGLGILMLTQPVALVLYTYSFVVILGGTIAFIITSHFPE